MAKQKKQAKSCSKRKTELDRISNLPSDVIGQILSRLCIMEAAKTSVLSRKWRFQSAMLPHLVFDNQWFSTQNRTTFENIVDQVLLLHIGPIHTFKLSHHGVPANSDIDRWILHLSRNGIKVFILEIFVGDPYKVSSWLFSCQDMVHLELVSCLLIPPSTFKGFRSLKRLDIEDVFLVQDVFDNLIVSCPLLEILALRYCYGFTHLNIHAPNLKSFGFLGYFEHVDLKNTLNLAEVNIDIVIEDGHGLAPAKSSQLVKFFLHLPHIRRLGIKGCFLAYLGLGGLPGKLPHPHLYLNFLAISINFSDLGEVSTVQCLLKSSPALQELEIVVNHDGYAADGEINPWLDDNQTCPLTQLRFVKITGVSDVKTELEFIEFLLLSSPVLVRMTFKPASIDDSAELLKKMIRFRRASVHSEIIYLDP